MLPLAQLNDAGIIWPSIRMDAAFNDSHHNGRHDRSYSEIYSDLPKAFSISIVYTEDN